MTKSTTIKKIKIKKKEKKGKKKKKIKIKHGLCRDVKI